MAQEKEYIERQVVLDYLWRRRELHEVMFEKGAAAFCEDCEIMNFVGNLHYEVFNKPSSLTEEEKEQLAEKYIDYISNRHNIDKNSIEGRLIYYAYIHGFNKCIRQISNKQ